MASSSKPFAILPQPLRNEKPQRQRFHVTRQRQHGKQRPIVEHQLDTLLLHDLVIERLVLTRRMEAADGPIDGSIVVLAATGPTGGVSFVCRWLVRHRLC
jgi:hypothetical protein